MKKPIVLASVKLKGHSMHRDSGLLLYWLTLLALVVLNMLVVIVVAILQFALGAKQFFFVVAALGFFFGYLTHKLVNLVENLEARHHFFAWFLVPAAAIANLLIISSAANNLSAAIGIGSKYNPLLVSLSYGIAFMVPLFASFASKSFTAFSPSGSRKKRG